MWHYYVQKFGWIWGNCHWYHLVTEHFKPIPLIDILMQYFISWRRLQDRSNINSLPDKLLFYIFTFLSPEDIGMAEMVCRRWHYIAVQDELWRIKCEELGKGVTQIFVCKVVWQVVSSFTSPVCLTKKKCSMCISDYMQITFF